MVCSSGSCRLEGRNFLVAFVRYGALGLLSEFPGGDVFVRRICNVLSEFVDVVQSFGVICLVEFVRVITVKSLDRPMIGTILWLVVNGSQESRTREFGNAAVLVIRFYG